VREFVFGRLKEIEDGQPESLGEIVVLQQNECRDNADQYQKQGGCAIRSPLLAACNKIGFIS